MCSAPSQKNVKLYRNNLKPLFFVKVTASVFCDVKREVFYKISNFRQLPTTSLLSDRAPRERKVKTFKTDCLTMSPKRAQQ
jgi:hypothetical protein